MKAKKRYIISNSIIMVIVLVLTLVGNSVALKWDGALSQYLGEIGGNSSNTSGSAYKNEEDLLEDQMKTTSQIVEEETVLLKNDEALPLGKNAKVSVFGIASAGKSAGGSGSGEVKGETYDLLSALEKEGMEVNPTLKKFYEESSHVHGSGAGPGGGDAMGDWKIDEVPQSEYTQDITSSYENYGDAALVVIGRRGGEGGDLPTEMSRFGQSADRHYLELSEEEEEKQVSDIWFFIITQQEDRHVKL